MQPPTHYYYQGFGLSFQPKEIYHPSEKALYQGIESCSLDKKEICTAQRIITAETFLNSNNSKEIFLGFRIVFKLAQAGTLKPGLFLLIPLLLQFPDLIEAYPKYSQLIIRDLAILISFCFSGCDQKAIAKQLAILDTGIPKHEKRAVLISLFASQIDFDALRLAIALWKVNFQIEEKHKERSVHLAQEIIPKISKNNIHLGVEFMASLNVRGVMNGSIFHQLLHIYLAKNIKDPVCLAHMESIVKNVALVETDRHVDVYDAMRLIKLFIDENKLNIAALLFQKYAVFFFIHDSHLLFPFFKLLKEEPKLEAETGFVKDVQVMFWGSNKTLRGYLHKIHRIHGFILKEICNKYVLSHKYVRLAETLNLFLLELMNKGSIETQFSIMRKCFIYIYNYVDNHLINFNQKEHLQIYLSMLQELSNVIHSRPCLEEKTIFKEQLQELEDVVGLFNAAISKRAH